MACAGRSAVRAVSVPIPSRVRFRLSVGGAATISAALLCATLARAAGEAGAQACRAVSDTTVLDFTTDPLTPSELPAAGEISGAPTRRLAVVPSGGLTDTIYVDAARALAGPAPGGPGLVSVIPLEGARGGADLGELLGRAVGLHVRRYGAPGAETLPSIRGSTGAQVAVLVDGLPLADAQDGVVDLAALPLERFDVAEIHRGSVPAVFGGGSAAGAVNLVSRAPGESGLSARLFAGAWGDRGGRLTGGWRSRDGKRAGLLLIHGRRADHDFVFLDHNQTFANAADDSERARVNAGFAEWGGWLSGRWDGGGLLARAAAGAFRRDAGRPGPLGFASPHAKARQERQDARLGLERPGGAWRLDLSGSRSRELLHDDAGEVGWDPPGTTRSRGHDLSARLTARGATTLARLPGPWPAGRGELTVGTDWRRQWYRESRDETVDPLRARTTATAFASLRLDAWGPRLTLAPGWRWQRLTDNFPPLPALPWLPETPLAAPRVQDAVSPSLGAIWEARPARLFCEAHAARSLRAPTWVELFGHRGGIDGNRELEPERTESIDAGVRWRPRGEALWSRLVVFRAVTEHTVVFVQNSQRTSQAVNFGRSRTSGVEWEAGGGIPGGPRWHANATWQDARDRGDDPAYRGKQLPFLPPLEIALLATLPRGAWELGASLVHQAANYRDRYNTELERAPARALVGVTLARTWRTAAATVTATAEVVNLTDDSVYDVEGFPLPGRAFRLSLFAR